MVRGWRKTLSSAAAARDRMVREQLVERGLTDKATLQAMAKVPRESFVAAELQDVAYQDRALAIENGQTISQPYIVARMTECLQVAGLGWPWTDTGPSLLDVGTGSGYQAAVLAEMGATVTSLERDPDLADGARARLTDLGYEVKIVVADGSAGYETDAPYAGIIVAAAAPALPPRLIEQLADGGRLVAPVGSRSAQRMTTASRRGATIQIEASEACVFVPLIGQYGYDA